MKNKKKNLKKVTLQDLYDAGWNHHVVLDYGDHQVASCEICQRIIKLGRKLNQQEVLEESKNNKRFPVKLSADDKETILKLNSNHESTKFIAEVLDRDTSTILKYLKSQGKISWQSVWTYTVQDTKDGLKQSHKKFYRLEDAGNLLGMPKSTLAAALNRGETIIRGFKVTRVRENLPTGTKWNMDSKISNNANRKGSKQHEL